ncbi:MAG: transglycosylase domain-containing protein [Desulfobia sp.]
MLKKIFIVGTGLVSLLIVLVVAAYFGLVVFLSGCKVERENIQNILSRQSPVYYSDGKTVLGVFFRNSHRLYIPYERIPENFVKAIIAAEDHDFFSHAGVDFSGIIRAFMANLRAGRIVQGGSTITQQTAKNLFKRHERSLQAKLRELLYALRLEYHYTKEEILTFYVNQFYVSGNGRGLGVAARYYFDKEVDELTLVESAFIAGSVKGPNSYNPFTKTGPRKKELVRQRAKERTAYVLNQMHHLGMIDTRSYRRALKKQVPFNKGRMRYPLNTVMDMVEEALNTEGVRSALKNHGIDNVATSGISVITTIDKKIQQSVIHSLRSTLSRLDIRLSGYERKKVQQRYAELNLVNNSPLSRGDFLLGRVTGIQSGEEPGLEVSWTGENKEFDLTGIISEKGLRPALRALVKYQRQRWSVPGEGDWPLLLDQIREGDLIYVSVRGHSDKTDKYEYELALEKYPELQGGALVIRNGTIKGIIGGYDNFYFNRAVQARRPMGSTFKPSLYTAAIQLGWNSLDLLDNRRRNFVYHDNAYVPQPDHYSPYEKISMAWAGVNSENVASVWLLYNLCDYLTPAQFKDLLSNLGLARQEGESYNHYKSRVRDRMGIVVDYQTLKRTAFANALSLCRADLAFAGREDELTVLERFVYSDRFADLAGKAEGREAEIRKEIFAYNFEHFRKLRDQLQDTAARLDGSQYFENNLVNNLYIRHSSGREALSGRKYRKALAEGDYVFALEDPGDKWEPVRQSEFLDLLSGMDKSARDLFWNSVSLDNLLSLETVNIVDNCFQEELKRLGRYPRYSPEVLYSVPDFRIMAGLKYLIGLCRAAGVRSDLEPVLSLPLGSNVVSLYELTRLYEGLLTGEIKKFGSGTSPGLSLISRIMAPDGEVIYSLDPESRKVADDRTVLEVSDILKNTVSYGTGRYAGQRIKIRESTYSRTAKPLTGDLQLPLFGKTGTADNYTNSAFVGAVPGLSGSRNGVNLENPDFIGVYLGYDDNRPMVRTSSHITGSSGALRAWTRIAGDVVKHKDYADTLDFVDLAFAGAEKVPLHYPDLGQIYVPVDRRSGIPLPAEGNSGDPETDSASVATFGRMGDKGELKLERHYRPYWRLEKTGDQR